MAVTLDQARKELLAAATRGARCPCCSRYVKVYKRRFHVEMGIFLVKLVKAWRLHRRWYHTSELIRTQTKAATDACYLVHWELLEHGQQGMYQPTQAGIEFCAGTLRTSAYVYLLNNTVLDWSEELVDIHAVLGKRFSLAELLAQ